MLKLCHHISIIKVPEMWFLMIKFHNCDTYILPLGVTNYTYPALVRLSIEGSAEVTRQDTSPLTVYLRNVNEHSPVVAMEPFSVIMSADVPVGSVIGKLPLVTDFDGQNGFNFSLVTDSPFGYVCVNSLADFRC